ncbi:MAG: hypothetical protein JNK64_34485 [Myxococcales bacterium]|nr:hypothetical protein [Myxococcales bacterium]
MAPLPPARARVHGVVGEAERAGAVVRHAARRTGVLAVATAKVVLWLGVVIASLVAIGSLGRSRHPRYPDLEALRRSTAQLERNRQALEASIRHQQLVDQLVRDVRDRELRSDRLTPPPALRSHR